MKFKAPSGVSAKRHTYQNFMGIDRSRDITALDTGDEQRLWRIENGYADWSGMLVKEAGADYRAGSRPVMHATFFGQNLGVWAEIDGGGVTLRSDLGHVESDPYIPNSVVSSTVFNRKVHFMSANQPIWTYDGIQFANLGASQKPGFGVAVQNRLAIAGIPGNTTYVDFSRVNNSAVFTADESPTDNTVTKAADLDIKNLIQTAEDITGLGVFEQDNLAIFTNNQAVVFRINPDYTQWQIDANANIKYGCIAHNTIAQAGADILFCARDGVHSMRRSTSNGIQVFTVPMSSRVALLYRELLKSCVFPERITAFFDQDEGQYHIFFPRSAVLCTRLTMTISPVNEIPNKWSTGTFLNAACGAALGGVTLLGTSDGVYVSNDIEDAAEVYPEMTIETPLLWHGNLTAQKNSRQIIIQASGQGVIEVIPYNEEGRQLGSLLLPIENVSDDGNREVPLSQQYSRKFEHTYRGLRLVFKVRGTGVIRIVGFAVLVEDQG